MASENGFPRTVFLFDLVLCLVFAVPIVSEMAIGLLLSGNHVLGLPGETAMPSGVGLFAVNFAGLLGVGLNLALLDSRAHDVHRINLGARAGVVALLIYHLIRSGLPASFLVFAITEIGGGLLTWRWLRQAAR